MAYQSLYRRYRSQRFGELKGQDHVAQPLRNAVRDSRVSHAYLFSGPRGTGKTSTARILAKALNCPNVDEGEPCGTCESCLAITDGRSLDVMELDAASNRGVDAMRELVSRASLGTPGRWKVYIVDEVHMLTTEASNTLLKTLEEPPGHVIFVLATTEPQKVLPTIRSRTQHYEFRLLPTPLLAEHLKWVAADAGLDVPPEMIDLVARRGHGSARDALSVLDQVAAAGGIDHHRPAVGELMEALCERDVAAALTAVAERCGAGHDPRQIATDLIEWLRQALLATVSPSLVGLPDDEVETVAAQAHRLGRAGTVRAMEVLGEALVDMREGPDTRILLDVALVRLCRPEVDSSPAAMLDRIERLERAVAGLRGPNAAVSHDRAPTEPASPAPSARATQAPPTEAPPSGPAAGARLALGGVRAGSRQPASRTAPVPPAAPAARPAPPRPTPAPPPVRAQGAAEPPTPAPSAPASTTAAAAPQPSAPPAPPPTGATPATPTRDELTLAWGDHVLAKLSSKARVRFQAGHFVSADDAGGVFALPNGIHRDRCQDLRPEVEAALAAHFGRPVTLRLVVEQEAAPSEAPPLPEDESIDLDDLQDAPAAEVRSPVDHVLQAFEGATVVEE